MLEESISSNENAQRHLLHVLMVEERGNVCFRCNGFAIELYGVMKAASFNRASLMHCSLSIIRGFLNYILLTEAFTYFILLGGYSMKKKKKNC